MKESNKTVEFTLSNDRPLTNFIENEDINCNCIPITVMVKNDSETTGGTAVGEISVIIGGIKVRPERPEEVAAEAVGVLDDERPLVNEGADDDEVEEEITEELILLLAALLLLLLLLTLLLTTLLLITLELSALELIALEVIELPLLLTALLLPPSDEVADEETT